MSARILKIPPSANPIILADNIFIEMQASFAGKLGGLGVKPELQKVMETLGIKDEEAYRILATEEKDIKQDIFEVFKGQGQEVKDPKDVIALKKLWV